MISASENFLQQSSLQAYLFNQNQALYLLSLTTCYMSISTAQLSSLSTPTLALDLFFNFSTTQKKKGKINTYSIS
jgi:hypothetical protein